jgi:cell wall-associated NlpC family hydrolase
MLRSMFELTSGPASQPRYAIRKRLRAMHVLSAQAVLMALLIAPQLGAAAPKFASPEFEPLAPAAAAASAADAIDRFLVSKGLISPASNPSSTESAFVNKVRTKASEMVSTAMTFLGVPYRRGGTSADIGFDCSGFTRQVFETSLGLILPRRADEQAKASGLVAIKKDELQPGDLVFFNTLRRTFSHVGIYLGDGKFIHAPKPGGEVRVEDMRFVYWAKRFTGARRAEPAMEQSASVSETIVPTPTTTGPIEPVQAIR